MPNEADGWVKTSLLLLNSEKAQMEDVDGVATSGGRERGNVLEVLVWSTHRWCWTLAAKLVWRNI